MNCGKKWVDVKLYTGRTIELNSFYEDKVQADPADVSRAVGLQVTIQRNPEGVYYLGESAKFNFERYVDAEETATAMDKISSTEAYLIQLKY